MSVKVYSRFVHREVLPAPVGSEEQSVFMEQMNDDGKMVLAVVSKTNIYDKIQASLASSNINNIVRRLGGMDMVATAYPMTGEYMDVTGMPTSLIEAQKSIDNFMRKFDGLDTETKKAFNNNPFEFIAAADLMHQGKFKEPMSDIVKKEGDENV